MITPKGLTKHCVPYLGQYGATEVSIVTQGDNHTMAVVTMTSRIKINVYGVPSTTSTPEKFVAQNVLKRARAAASQGINKAAYGGGK